MPLQHTFCIPQSLAVEAVGIPIKTLKCRGVHRSHSDSCYTSGRSTHFLQALLLELVSRHAFGFTEVALRLRYT